MRRGLLLGFGCSVVMMLAGCESRQPIAWMDSRVRDHEALPKTGTGIVRGQVVLETAGGDAKFGAGSAVTLHPVTVYSLQGDGGQYQGVNRTESSNAGRKAYERKTTADRYGNFVFTNVPPGEYLVLTPIRWSAPVGDQGSPVRYGGWVRQRIKVQDGQETNVTLTQ